MNMNNKQSIEQACNKLINLYYHYNDQGDFKAVSELFTENGSFARPTDPENFTTGKQNILAAYEKRPRDRIARHVISNIIINVIDEEHATGTCYATLFMAPIDAEKATFGVKANPSQLVGEFELEFELTSDGWRISRQTGRVIFTT
jgi:hypothetical protein